MRLVAVTDADRRALDAALRTTKRAREWRRLQAVRLLADGRAAPEVAQVLGCSASSVYYWANDWRAARVAGLAEGPHAGRPRRLDVETAAPREEHLLADDPQAHGSAATDWTVPLVRTAVARSGYDLSARTLRRTLHRLGVRWKRPK
jgi:transposase